MTRRPGGSTLAGGDGEDQPPKPPAVKHMPFTSGWLSFTGFSQYLGYAASGAGR